MKKLRIFLEMIKFEHTLFALPFAFMGAIVGAISMEGRLPSWSEIGWIILAMVGARSAAMGLNRVIDRFIDAKNPRTATRAIPAGLLGLAEVWLFIVASFVLLFVAASQLDPICVKLLPIAVVLLVGYSYTKRFTWACHLILGLTIGLAPLGGWVAVTGSLDASAYVLYIAVACWIAGFDVLYACQDSEFDKDAGLYSIPSYFGVAKGLVIARLLHAITAAGFVALIAMTGLGWWYAIGVIGACGLLLYEHRLVKPNDLSRIQLAFFTLNGTLSIVVFAFTLIDVAVSVW